ncbi:MAG: hypothetical protein KDA61_14195, partial [Planctomycetales bacterium]|nr:hypothetical protein [Planctomycetales bacterium]
VDNDGTPDTTAPTVTIDQAAGQGDPTSSSPILFTVVFSEPVVGFTTGDVTLSGTLDVDVVQLGGSDYLPAVGDVFTVLTSTGSLSGTFANAGALVASSHGYEVSWSIQTTPNAVTIEATSVVGFGLAADFDMDGDVDDDDLQLWSDNLGLRSTRAHCLGDADDNDFVDGNDLLIWQRQRGMTAAAFALQHAAPEPTSGALALLLLTGLLQARNATRRVPSLGAGSSRGPAIGQGKQ